jgi:hypothetical protein
VYRPKEGQEVVLMYSNEGVQVRHKIRKEPETRIEQRVKKKVVIAGIERLYGDMRERKRDDADGWDGMARIRDRYTVDG